MMKRFKGMIVALFVAYSVFLITGSAGAVSVWNVVHSSMTVMDSTATTLNGFGIYDPYGSGSEALLSYTNVFFSTVGIATLNYVDAENTFYYDDGTKFLTLSTDTFSFYYSDGNGNNVYDLEGSPVGIDLYSFENNKFLADDIKPSSVPIPAAVLLFGSGLAGLVGLKRRKGN